MTSPDMDDEAMKAMAAWIADAAVENHAAAKGTHTWEIARDAAYAAIIETTELAAKYAEYRVGFGLTNLAADYRAAAHFQKDHPHA